MTRHASHTDTLRRFHVTALFVASCVFAASIAGIAYAGWMVEDSTETRISTTSLAVEVITREDIGAPAYPGEDITRDVSVQNTGEADIFVRIQLSTAFVTADGTIKQDADDLIEVVYDPRYWKNGNDGYWYLRGSLAPGETSANCVGSITLSSAIPASLSGYTAQVTPQAEALQITSSAITALWGKDYRFFEAIEPAPREEGHASITFVSPEGGFIFVPDTKDIFPDAKELTPGESVTHAITFANTFIKPVEIRVKPDAISTSREAELLSEQSILTIIDHEGKVLYDGPAAGEEWNSFTHTLILEQNTAVTWKVSLHIKPSAPNELQGLDTSLLSWDLHAEEHVPSPPPTPGGGGSYPLTGDTPLLLVCSLAALISAIVLLILANKGNTLRHSRHNLACHTKQTPLCHSERSRGILHVTDEPTSPSKRNLLSRSKHNLAYHTKQSPQCHSERSRGILHVTDEPTSPSKQGTNRDNNAPNNSINGSSVISVLLSLALMSSLLLGVSAAYASSQELDSENPPIESPETGSDEQPAQGSEVANEEQPDEATGEEAPSSEGNDDPKEEAGGAEEADEEEAVVEEETPAPEADEPEVTTLSEEATEQDDAPRAADQFQFQVTVAAGEYFSIPASGNLGGSNTNKVNYWNIDWGDGTVNTNVTVVQSSNQNGIAKPSSYSRAGTYTITLTPAGSTEAWLSCFGFDFVQSGANIPDNKRKVTKVLGPITPNMTRTAAQYTANAPSNEWSYSFSNCNNLTEGPHLSGWDEVTVAGDNFLHGIFFTCTSLRILPEGFTLPPNLQTVGSPFASNMFTNCTALTTLPSSFNFPQNLITVGNSFAYQMFSNCGALATLPRDFSLPRNITTVGTGFAYQMFYQAGSASFQLNEAFVFPALSAAETSKNNVFTQTFQLSSNAPRQNRTAHSIINGCATPSSARQTFGSGQTVSPFWVDQPGIHQYWGGLAVADYFQLEVSLTAAGSFSLPASGLTGGSNTTKSNTWSITWGDGSATQTVTVTQSSAHTGVPHTYAKAGSYLITISPGSANTQAWLSCFGFYAGAEGANAPANKQKVTRVYGPITPNMTRTNAQITGTGPASEWYQTFMGCTNLMLGPSMSGWEGVTTAGDNFWSSLFQGCASLTTIPLDFNLPQNLVSVGSDFASHLFQGCTSLTNLPAGFTLPQGVSTIGINFANQMFYGAGSASFQLNTAFTFPPLTQPQASQTGVFYQSFLLSSQAPLQARTATAVINSCATPASPRQTFGDAVTVSEQWIDQPELHTNWGGIQLSATLTIEFILEEPPTQASDFMLKITNTDTNELCTKLITMAAGDNNEEFTFVLPAGVYVVQTVAEGSTWRYAPAEPNTAIVVAGGGSHVDLFIDFINPQWQNDTGRVVNAMKNP